MVLKDCLDLGKVAKLQTYIILLSAEGVDDGVIKGLNKVLDGLVLSQREAYIKGYAVNFYLLNDLLVQLVSAMELYIQGLSGLSRVRLKSSQLKYELKLLGVLNDDR